MSAETKDLRMAADAKLAPQYFNPSANQYEYVEGDGGATHVKVVNPTTGVVKEPFSGSTNITKTFSSPMNGFVISNDGGSNLTFTIDTNTLTVRSGEVFEADFSPFTKVTITSSVPYRAYGKALMGYNSNTVVPPVVPPVDTTPPIITASPNSGTFTSAQAITLSANEQATIYYTTNGSTPTTSSAVYTAPINLNSTTTLKYFGKDLVGNSSVVETKIYTIDTSIPDTTPPVITTSPDGGVYTGTQSVILNANETATIYYTTNGDMPTESSPVYSSPIVISETTVLKYFGKDTSGNSSDVETKTYTIEEDTGLPGGTHVDDASLLLFQINPANNQTIAEPDKYFQTNKPFTIFVTFQPIADSNSAVTFFQRKTPNAVEHEFTWNSNILFTLTGKKDQGTGTTNYPQVRKDGVTDHSISYHTAVVRDSTKMHLYVNNSKVHEVDCDSNFFVDHSTAPLKFAELNKSQIKNMGYYDRALNEAELTQNYEALK